MLLFFVSNCEQRKKYVNVSIILSKLSKSLFQKLIYLFFFSFYSASSILRFQFRSRYIYMQLKKWLICESLYESKYVNLEKCVIFFFLTLNNFLSIHFIWKVARSGIPAPRKRYLLLLHYVGNSIESKRDISFYSAR